jgi:hypothetical protein
MLTKAYQLLLCVKVAVLMNSVGAGKSLTLRSFSWQSTDTCPLFTLVNMTSIDVLEIAGIRSFAPEPPQVSSVLIVVCCVALVYYQLFRAGCAN